MQRIEDPEQELPKRNSVTTNDSRFLLKWKEKSDRQDSTLYLENDCHYCMARLATAEENGTPVKQKSIAELGKEAYL